jgi:sRNA-binding protein
VEGPLPILNVDIANVRALIGSVIATFHDPQAPLKESEARPLKIKLFTFLMGKVKFAKNDKKS